MPVLAIFIARGLTIKMYEDLRKEVLWEDRHPAGAILHAAAADENGDMHVADIWDSAEALNEFVTSRLMPGFQKLGIPPPEAQVFPAHNINAYHAIERYRI